MAITDIPILSMLRTRMEWHQERQRVLAENVANADTPDYRPKDLAPLNFENALMDTVSRAAFEPIRIISAGRTTVPFRRGGQPALRGAARRQRRQPRRRDDESRVEPDGFRRGGGALFAQPGVDQTCGGQILSRFSAVTSRRRARSEREARPMDFIKSLVIAASGLHAQLGRMRIITENIANADSTSSAPAAIRTAARS